MPSTINFILLFFLTVDSSNPSKKRGSITLTCQLSDTSEVTDYEWVHVVYDHNNTQSVGSIQKGKFLRISKVSEENRGEWACRFYGEEGILGNVTHHIQLMSKFLPIFSIYDNRLQVNILKIYQHTGLVFMQNFY